MNHMGTFAMLAHLFSLARNNPFGKPSTFFNPSRKDHPDDWSGSESAGNSTTETFRLPVWKCQKWDNRAGTDIMSRPGVLGSKNIWASLSLSERRVRMMKTYHGQSFRFTYLQPTILLEPYLALGSRQRRLQLHRSRQGYNVWQKVFRILDSPR
jgi:hypothetical protein